MTTTINKEELLKILRSQKEEFRKATSPSWGIDDGWCERQDAKIDLLGEIIALIESWPVDIKEK